MKTIRIGGACAFFGDSSVAPTQLIAAGVDYLILDYLAEATMSSLGAMRRHRANLGYATDFTEWVWKDNLPELKRTGTKIVTNAGGVNPRACRERMEKIAAEVGVSLRIAIVEGDEVLDRLGELSVQGELITGAPFPDKDKVVTANAYLGAGPIARALAMGADVVITGRCVDSAVTLGVLVHEFGWQAGDHDKLAQGTLAGHLYRLLSVARDREALVLFTIAALLAVRTFVEIDILNPYHVGSFLLYFAAGKLTDGRRNVAGR